MKQILAFAAAVCGGLTLMFTVANMRFMSSSAKALAQYISVQTPATFTEKVGEILARRISVGGVESYRRWLALESQAPTYAQVLGTSAIIGGVFTVIAVLLSVPVLFLMAAIGFIYPFAKLRSRANAVKRRVQRSLPEMAALMAAEMSAGNPPDRAIERAADFGGPLGAIIRQALENARKSGRPLFGRGNMSGELYNTVQYYELPSLRAFISQIELAARKGTAGPELMQTLARTLIIEYKDRALREAEQLDNRLAVPAVLFFFLPFLFILLVPMLIPLLRMM